MKNENFANNRDENENFAKNRDFVTYPTPFSAARIQGEQEFFSLFRTDEISPEQDYMLQNGQSSLFFGL